MPAATIFRSVDSAAFVAAFTDRLRSAGVEVGLSSVGRFSEAMTHCAPTDAITLYWVARTCLIHDRDDLAVFDAVFHSVFEAGDLSIMPVQRDAPRVTIKPQGTVVQRSAPTDATTGRITATSRPVIVDDVRDVDDRSEQPVLPELLPSGVAELADTPFHELSVEDLDELGRWLNTMMTGFPMRRTRRFRPVKHSRSIDLRRTLLIARATGGEPIRLARRRVRKRPRKIVMLVDLSGSMESFSRIYLHLMRSLAVHGRAEVFTFSTSLRRATPQLRDRDPMRAIDRLSDDVVDRFGGTKIAASLSQLLGSPIWSNAVRGAIVVIASDGWDADHPDLLERRMLQLRRMAHRIIWINPRSAATDFEPLVGGMAAALPFTDELLSGHTLNAMRTVITSIASATNRS